MLGCGSYFNSLAVCRAMAIAAVWAGNNRIGIRAAMVAKNMHTHYISAQKLVPMILQMPLGTRCRVGTCVVAVFPFRMKLAGYTVVLVCRGCIVSAWFPRKLVKSTNGRTFNGMCTAACSWA